MARLRELCEINHWSGPPDEAEGFLSLEAFQLRLVDYSRAVLSI